MKIVWLFAILLGATIWAISASVDTIVNGADLLGFVVTAAGAWMFIGTPNKENESDR